MNLVLKKEKDVVVRVATSEVKETVTEVEIVSINDNCKDAVTAAIRFNGKTRMLKLWEGAEYTKIGDWTQDQANARIEELL